MKSISYHDYFDRVYGCFLGKCIGGTAGGPAEGRKELLDYPLDEPSLHVMLPNDDLDLQILWLEVLEEHGVYCTARQMAEAFHAKIPYGPGEYAYAKKNIGRGIFPPLSGCYNNRYYINGMGCPIRSEIWGCLFPGAPTLTRHYTDLDGTIDHEHDSVEAEYFLASLEAEAFFLTDLDTLLDRAVARLNPTDRITRTLADTIRWHREGLEWKAVRARILRDYGHADCTNLYQNMGFTVLALLAGGGDFRETIRIGLACGYDTDCICATAASVLGILRGAKQLLADGLTDTGLKIAIDTRRRECSIASLAADVCAAGMTMADVYDGTTAITDRPAFTPIPIADKRPAYDFSPDYGNEPVLLPDQPKIVALSFVNRTAETRTLSLALTAPVGIVATLDQTVVTLPPHGTVVVPMTAALDADARMLRQKNLFTLTVTESNEVSEEIFGLVGADVWLRYGPFIENNRDLTHVPPHENYWRHIHLNPGEDGFDVTRDYHLSHIARIEKPWVDETIPFTAIHADGKTILPPQILYTTEDRLDLADIQSFEGPHIDYLVRTFLSETEQDSELVVGHTAPFQLWLNGDYVGGSDASAWWTCENRHFSVRFRAGENVLILKCAQFTNSAQFSVIPRVINGGMTQIEDLPSVLPNP